MGSVARVGRLGRNGGRVIVRCRSLRRGRRARGRDPVTSSVVGCSPGPIREMGGPPSAGGRRPSLPTPRGPSTPPAQYGATLALLASCQVTWSQAVMSHPQPANLLRVPDFKVVPGSPFKNDQMNRQPVITDWTARYIDNAMGACCLAINGDYGTGKSAMLGMWAEHLRNDNKRYRVAEINLWKTCYLDNPLLACLLEFDKQQIIRLDESGWWHQLIGLAKRGIPVVADLVVPGGSIVSSVIDGSSSDNKGLLADLRAFASYDTILQEFNEKIDGHLDEKRLVIFVDELDRCDATYAVRCLEVIKLLFTSPKVTFVVGVNLGQLDKAVRRRYGWDSEAYRRRFFDLTRDVPPPTSHLLKMYCDNSLAHLGMLHPAQDARRMIQDAFLGDPDQSGNGTAESVPTTTLSLRELRQFLNGWSIVCSRLLSDASIPEGYQELVLELTTAMLIAKHTAPKLYHKMLEGTCSDADVFEAVDSALGSRATIFTSPLVARLKSILSLCVIVSDHAAKDHDIRIMLDRSSIAEVRSSKLWRNDMGEFPQAGVPAHRELADGLFKEALNEMASLNFTHINRIVSEVEGYESGALG